MNVEVFRKVSEGCGKILKRLYNEIEIFKIVSDVLK